MNQILIDQKDIPNDEKGSISLSNPEVLFHLEQILKIAPGAPLLIGAINGARYQTLVKSIDSKHCIVEILEILPVILPPQKIHILLGISRPPTLQKIFEHASTLGIASITLFKAQLSDKSYLQSKMLGPEVYTPFLLRGLSQSKFYTQLPQVHVCPKLSDLKQLHPQIFAASPNTEANSGISKFLLQASAPNNFLRFQPTLQKSSTLYLAIGPERGMTREEDDFFIQAGLQPIKISQAILRVEFALYSALAQIELIASLSREQRSYGN